MTELFKVIEDGIYFNEEKIATFEKDGKGGIIMNDIQVFDFEENAVRVIDRDGEPWFVAADVCRVLDLTNPTVALESLDDDERAKLNLGRSKSGGGGESNIISESGLYILILRCRDAVKKGTVPYRFRKWVTAEVLPSIRKTGVYVSPEVADKEETNLSDLPDRTFQQWINLVRETRLLFGRSAARSVWAKSPLPAPEIVDRTCPAEETYTEADGLTVLTSVVAACFDEAGRVLSNTGVRRMNVCGRDVLFIAQNHPFLNRVFDQTPFGRHFKNALLMIKGAFLPRSAVRIGNWQGRGVFVPFVAVSDLMKQAA